MRFFKKHKILTALICLALFAALAVLCINIYMVCSTAKYITDSDSRATLSAAEADCILVLGAGVWDGELSPLLQDRVDAGIDLFNLGASDRLLMSGDHGRTDYDEVNAMKDYAAEKGIDPECIFMDHAGFSTYESMYRAAEIFKAKKVIIVSQEYHLYRAVYIARALGLEAYGAVSNPREYTLGTDIYNNVRESAARVKDFFNVIIRPEPTYLGDAIPISGKGSATDDRK